MMRKLLVLASLILLAFLAGLYIAHNQHDVIYAAANSTIPLSFGACRGAMGSELLIFEDAQGIVRLVHPASGMVYGTVTRK